MLERIRTRLTTGLSIVICLFTIYEVNYGLLPPLSQMALFALLGTVICFLSFPVAKKFKDVEWLQGVDLVLSLLMTACCGYILWEGQELGNRAGKFTSADLAVAIAGTVLVIEATRRSIGLALPILASVFLLYAFFGPSMPDWLFPHRGYPIDRIAAQCFLRSEGVFGIAMRVMFTYVFLFVVFGAFLELSGATQYIIDFANRIFGRWNGGPAMVSVFASGLMGSLSGSAVANAVTTGTFTIPMMRNSGFEPRVAGGVTAAAASGAALMPPVMGAGAYMMLEIIPDVTFLEIVKAAVVPALLYYISLLLIVFFYARRVGDARPSAPIEKKPLLQYSGIVFVCALGALIGFLLAGFTVFRAVTYALEVILVLTILNPKMDVSRRDRLLGLAAFALAMLGMRIYRLQGENPQPLADWTSWLDAAIPGMVLLLLAALFHPAWGTMVRQAFIKSAKQGVALVSASACVGIIIGVVGLTGVGSAFPNAILPLAEQSLLAALVAIMLCSIVLGMGLPSAVCYLLMATLIGPVLNRMGVVPLGAHLFIFYFGMMSMVTPPVALAAYASASIAESKIMPTAMASFRFALVGFTLPYMFVYRPELLLMNAQGGPADIGSIALAIGAALLGVFALAAGIAGCLKSPLSMPWRAALVGAAALLLSPDLPLFENPDSWLEENLGLVANLAGVALLVLIIVLNWLVKLVATTPSSGLGSA